MQQLIIILLCAITAIIFLSAWYELGVAINIAVGGLFSLYVPGLLISHVFFPNQRSGVNADINATAIDAAERQILSVFLSICVVILALVIVRYLSIELNSFRVILIIIAINISAIIGCFISCKLRGRGK